MKVAEKEEARRLRIEDGFSIKQIAREVSASPSSVSLWVRDIELTPSQQGSLDVRSWNSRRKKIGEKARNRRRKYQNEGRELARKHRCDFEFVAGCMLYWAEGANDRGSVRFVNSDVEMMSLFLGFLKKFFGNNEVAVKVKYYTDVYSGIEIERYWLDALNLPDSCLRKGCADYYQKGKESKSKGKLPYGTCTLMVYSVILTQKIFGAIHYI